MNTIYTFSLTALLIPLSICSAKELDQDRLKRIERRFGKMVHVKDSLAAGVPELPIEQESEEVMGWNLFGKKEEILEPSTVAPQLTRRYVNRRTATPTEDETGWGILHAEVVQKQEQREAEQLALEEAASLRSEEAWNSPAMSEEDIQREVAWRLQQESAMLAPQEDSDKINPLKQLEQYKAMGQDYLSPAQKMLSPDYTRSRIAQLTKDEDTRSTRTQNQFSTSTLTPQTEGRSTPYGTTTSTWDTSQNRSTLPRTSSITPQQNNTSPNTSKKRSIQDLKRLPSLSEEDPFAEKFPTTRSSIWDD